MKIEAMEGLCARAQHHARLIERIEPIVAGTLICDPVALAFHGEYRDIRIVPFATDPAPVVEK